MPQWTAGRRCVLGAVLALPVLSVASGCRKKGTPARDMPVLVAAIAAEQDLVLTYEAARSARAAAARLLDPALAHHREHVTFLRRHYIPGSGDRAHEGAEIPAPKAMALPSSPGRAQAALRQAEGAAAARLAAAAATADPGLAQLFASIGACDAGHAGQRPVAVPRLAVPPGAMRGVTLDSMQKVLAAEHLAVYGYGVLGAKVPGTPHRTARTLWDAHRVQRDALTDAMSASGARPQAAAAAYRLPVRPNSARGAAQLAAALEDRVVAACVELAGAPVPSLRHFAAAAAQAAMGRAAQWRASAGLPVAHGAFPGLPPAALTPAPRPGD
ncbi:DUF4439 domain-containing protein [Spirillospora sp. CA-294931]|uniref:DUF4439 domain-containing protein n=1 Tax=Spirillospora sp. CA-294931 TaxID=3240042 RepID=UPI003D8E3D30